MTVEYKGSIYRNDANLAAWISRQPRETALDPELAIIDPHHHLWDARWGKYLLPDFLDDISGGHNVVATVYVEAGAMYRQDGPEYMKPLGEVEFANGVAAMCASGAYGKTLIAAGIVGFADLRLGGDVRPLLEKQVQAGGGRLRGIRYSVPWDEEDKVCQYLAHYVPPHQLADKTFRLGFSELERLGLSYDVWMLHPQIPDLTDLATDFPNTTVVLDHLGSVLGVGRFAGKRDETFRGWRRDLAELANCPNVNVKIGGMGMTQCGFDFHLHDRPGISEALAEAWRPYVETCVELFGVDRCMFESNFPPDKQSAGYTEIWNAFKRIAARYSSAEKEALFYKTAARVYRLEPPFLT